MIDAAREVVYGLTVGVAGGLAVAGAVVTILMLHLAIEPVVCLAVPWLASELPKPFRA